VTSSDSPSTGIDQPQLLEMHGRLFDVKCTSKSCGHIKLNFDSPICPALGGTETVVESGILDPSIPRADLPRCSECGKLARPGVVWFGEMPVHLDIIDDLVASADLCLVVGTSSTVSHENWIKYMPP
jgi:NAD+-dependent protein deacetylase sirtuin 5